MTGPEVTGPEVTGDSDTGGRTTATDEQVPGVGAPESPPDGGRPHHKGPATTSWRRVLFVGCICFAVWLLFDAPSLQRAAQESPFGARRTVSLDVVGPIAAVSRGLGLSWVVRLVDDVLDRAPGGGPTLAAVTVPPTHHRPPPPPHGPNPPSTTTTTFPVLNQHPTAADPLRVLVVGDSIGIDLGGPLSNDLTGTGVVQATFDGKVDTGLARPDYFNWPAELQADLANDHPDLVVVMMGANDPQAMTVGGNVVDYGTPAWNVEYGARVGSILDEASAAGARTLWVGMPPMQGAQLNGEMQVVNGIVQSQVALRPATASYLSSWDVLGTSQGGFQAYATNAAGAEVNIRTPDGIHLSPGGGEWLSQAVIADLRARLGIDLPPG